MLTVEHFRTTLLKATKVSPSQVLLSSHELTTLNTASRPMTGALTYFSN